MLPDNFASVRTFPLLSEKLGGGGVGGANNPPPEFEGLVMFDTNDNDTTTAAKIITTQTVPTIIPYSEVFGFSFDCHIFFNLT